MTLIRDHLKEKGIEIPFTDIPARDRFYVETVFPDGYSDEYKFCVYDARHDRPLIERPFVDGVSGGPYTTTNHDLAIGIAEQLNFSVKEIYKNEYKDVPGLESSDKDKRIQSHRQNSFAADQMSKAIKGAFDGMHLDTKCVDNLYRAYGAERVGYIFATTVKYHSWDGRFSGANKKWAEEYFDKIGVPYDEERASDYCLTSHSAITDGAISTFREKEDLYVAMDLIKDYIQCEYDEIPKDDIFDDLKEVSLAYTYIDNDDLEAYDIPIQVSCDLENFRIVKDIFGYPDSMETRENGFVVEYGSLKELIDSELKVLDFNDLICLPDRAWESIYEYEMSDGKEPDENGVYTWREDEKTGLSCGLNERGEIFIGDDKSGCTIPFSLENKERFLRDYEYLTEGRLQIDNEIVINEDVIPKEEEAAFGKLPGMEAPDKKKSI